jgi:hypothetical protein
LVDAGAMEFIQVLKELRNNYCKLISLSLYLNDPRTGWVSPYISVTATRHMAIPQMFVHKSPPTVGGWYNISQDTRP